MGSASSSQLQSLEVSHKAVYETLEYDLYDAHDGYRKLSLFHFKINSDPDLIDFAVSRCFSRCACLNSSCGHRHGRRCGIPTSCSTWITGS